MKTPSKKKLKVKSLKQFKLSKYTVDSLGRIKNTKTDKYMSYYKNNSGYLCVSLTKDKATVKSNHPVHRLVCMAFHPNPDNLPDVAHKDKDKLNIVPSNLMWMKHDANVKMNFSK